MPGAGCSRLAWTVSACILWLNDGTQRVVDHVGSGPAIRVNVARYPFMSADVLDRTALVKGYPQLDAGFETSLPALHFLGAPAAWSFGPLMRFVAGTEFSSRALARRVAAVRHPGLVFGGDVNTRANGPVTLQAKSGAI